MQKLFNSNWYKKKERKTALEASRIPFGHKDTLYTPIKIQHGTMFVFINIKITDHKSINYTLICKSFSDAKKNSYLCNRITTNAVSVLHYGAVWF